MTDGKKNEEPAAQAPTGESDDKPVPVVDSGWAILNGNGEFWSSQIFKTRAGAWTHLFTEFVRDPKVTDRFDVIRAISTTTPADEAGGNP